MIDLKNVYWLAGLLEGEGSFFNSTYGNRYCHPTIALKMADRDVINRAAALLGRKVDGGVKTYPSRSRFRNKSGELIECNKPMHGIRVCRQVDAVGWMMMLYPLLGERRRAKIKELLSEWRINPRHPYHWNIRGVDRVWARRIKQAWRMRGLRNSPLWKEKRDCH